MNRAAETGIDWRSALDLLDRLGCGGLVIDHGGRIFERNDVARKLTGHWDAKLPADVHHAIDRLDQESQKVAWLDHRRRQPLVLNLVKQPDGASGTMLLVLIDPAQPARIEAAVVRRLFGLTGAESNLAVRLARGERVHAIAQARGVSLGTVRSQLRTIFSKTRTKSQAGLVLLLARLTTIQSEH